MVLLVMMMMMMLRLLVHHLLAAGQRRRDGRRLLGQELGELGAAYALLGRVEGLALLGGGALADGHVLVEGARIEPAPADAARQQAAL